MRINNLKGMIMLLLCAMFVLSISSCHDDDDEKKTSPKPSTENAGSFEIINNTDGTIISENVAKLRKGNILHLKFTPEKKCEAIPFSLTYVLQNDTTILHGKTEADVPLNGENELVVYVEYRKEGIIFETRRTIHIEYLDEKTGHFVIKNITSGETIDGDEAYIVPEDTLTITFIPEEKFKDVSFKIKKTDYGEEINDTLVFHSTSSKITINGVETDTRHRIELSAEPSNGYDNVNRTINVFFYDKSSSAKCRVLAMADLLMFVDPVIKFSDNKGNNLECRPFDGITIKRDSIDIDGMKLELANDWSKAFRYTQWGSEAEATMAFVRKQPVELTRDSYDLDCSLLLRGYAYEKDFSPLSASITINIGITVGGKNKMTDEYGKIKKEYVEEYINKLVETTQTKRIKIDENGKVTEIFN